MLDKITSDQFFPTFEGEVCHSEMLMARLFAFDGEAEWVWIVMMRIEHPTIMTILAWMKGHVNDDAKKGGLLHLRLNPWHCMVYESIIMNGTNVIIFPHCSIQEFEQRKIFHQA